MQVSIQIRENDAQIINHINVILVDKLNKVVRSAIPSIRNRLKEAVKVSLQTTYAYASLANGKLQQEFGLIDGQARIDRIIAYWCNTIFIHFDKVKISGTSFSGTLTIGIIEDSYSGAMALPEASVLTEAGTMLHWLHWLLLEGDKVIIKNYTIKNEPQDSRTGSKIMIKSKSRSWSVPPEFSGTKDDNFVTRALDNLESNIDTIIEDEISRRWH